MKRWFKFPIAYWLAGLVVLALVVFVLGAIFVRRDVVTYRMPHSLAVSNPAFFSYAHALADPMPFEGNKIELLHNGDEIFPAMLTAIRGAKRSINFEAFLFYSGKVATDFENALSERARAGVKVLILLDGVGSSVHLNNGEVERLKEAGCGFAYYHPTRAWRVDRLNQRTHRRILVVDGRIGFTGGVGFSDNWLGNADSPKHWRDDQVRIEGPVVTKLQAAFFQHWAQQTGEALKAAEDFPVQEKSGTTRAQVVTSRAFSLAPLAWLQAAAFSSAEKTIFITNAYCAPSDSQVEHLVDAVKRGVDVKLLLPGPHNDQPLTKAAGRTAYRDLLRGGVKIYEYQPTMIHSKTMVIDGILSLVGSSNFDARSAQINEELDLTVYDRDFGKQMEAVFERDLKSAKLYTLEDFERRSLWERFSEWIMMPFHSQM
jgi:cardiolipin synthase